MIYLAIGPSNCGKTHLLREWLLPALMAGPQAMHDAAPARFRGLLIDDPPTRAKPEGQYPGPRYRDVAAWRGSERRTRVSCFDQADSDALLELALELGDAVLVLDEIEARLGARSPLSAAAQRVINRGRHDGVCLVGSAHRLHNLSTELRGNSQVLYYGNLTEPADASYAARMAGVDEEVLKDLPFRVFLEHDRARSTAMLITIDGGRRRVVRDLKSRAA